MKKFLLIGSDGFIGSNFKRFLRKRKREVLCINYNYYLNLNKNIERKIKQSDIIIHFAISSNLNNPIEFAKDIKRSKLIFTLSKYHKKKCIFISSISADKLNKSKYSILKIQLEKIASKNNVTIIRPGMVWSKQPRSWFEEVDSFAKNFFFIFPMLGSGNKPLYTVELKQFLKILFDISENKKGKFVVHDNKIYRFIDIFKICLKRYKKTGLIFRIPLYIVYLISKILNKVGLMNNRYYDSLISYKYTSYKKFKNFKILKTNVSFKNYSKIRHNNYPS